MGPRRPVGRLVLLVTTVAAGAACGTPPIRTIDAVAPAQQNVRAFPVTVADRSGQVLTVDVRLVATSVDGFTRQDRARNVVGRADQVVVMWAGGGCDEGGKIDVEPAGPDRLRFTLDRIFKPCAISAMDRVLLTFARPVDAGRIEVQHVEPPAVPGPEGVPAG